MICAVRFRLERDDLQTVQRERERRMMSRRGIRSSSAPTLTLEFVGSEAMESSRA